MQRLSWSLAVLHILHGKQASIIHTTSCFSHYEARATLHSAELHAFLANLSHGVYRRDSAWNHLRTDPNREIVAVQRESEE